MRAIQAQECADLPRFSLVAGGSPVLLVVIQGDSGFDDFGDRAFVLGSFDAEGVEGVLGQTDGECGVFGGHHFTASNISTGRKALPWMRMNTPSF